MLDLPGQSHREAGRLKDLLHNVVQVMQDWLQAHILQAAANAATVWRREQSAPPTAVSGTLARDQCYGVI